MNRSSAALLLALGLGMGGCTPMVSQWPVSYQIAIGALMLVGGFYYLGNAFRYGEDGALALNMFNGIGGIAIGVMFLFFAMF